MCIWLNRLLNNKLGINMKSQIIKFLAIIVFSVLLQQCCTSQEGIKEKNNVPVMKTKKQLQRGMVDITYLIKEVFEKENINYCLAKIIKVNGYGGGVKQLAEESEYEFEITKNLIEEIRSKKGETIRSKISSLPEGIGQNRSVHFKIVSVNKL